MSHMALQTCDSKITRHGAPTGNLVATIVAHKCNKELNVDIDVYGTKPVTYKVPALVPMQKRAGKRMECALSIGAG